jgi:hypothetical protein
MMLEPFMSRNKKRIWGATALVLLVAGVVLLVLR